jgi:hypothetical protein
MDTNVSEEHVASNLGPEDEGGMFLRNYCAVNQKTTIVTPIAANT